MHTRLMIFALATAFAACKPRENGSTPQAAPEDRRILGAAAPFPAAPLEFDLLHGSMAARRTAGWSTLAKILAPTPLRYRDDTIPLWQTWLDQREFEVLFTRLYEDLGKEGRAARRPFAADAIERVMKEHADAAIPGWDEERFTKRLGQIKQREDVQGLSGRGVTLFSPELVRHYLENYRDVIACVPKLKTLAPDADPPSPSVFTPCFAKEFPLNAAAIKTNWIVATETKGVARFATDPAALAAAWSSGEWTKKTEGGDAKPTPAEIYTLRMASGATFRLAGIHVITKELRDWMWVTAWWADDPNEDFGADRPASLTADERTSPAWAHYKMCAVSAYGEGDPDPGASYASTHPSLAAALRSTSERAGLYTLCSNPYIERGRGNARTNCIGCHQHAGAEVDTDEIYADETKYPDHARSKQRRNFPGDYLWSFSNDPDYFAQTMRNKSAELDSYDAD